MKDHWEGPLATKSPGCQPPWLSHVGACWKGTQTAAEVKDDRRAESRFAINMGWHATRRRWL